MLGALSTNRNYGGCCDQIRPYIAIVEPTSEQVVTTTGGSGAGDIDFDNLTVNSLVANTIQSGTISTNQLATSIIFSFSVPVSNDVDFFGSNANNFLRWDSSENTLYLENSVFKTSSCFLFLNNPADETPPTEPDRDNGIVFKWRDNVVDEDKTAFFGFIDQGQRFRFIPNVTVDADNCEITPNGQDNGDFEVQDIYLRNIIGTTDDMDILVNGEIDIGMDTIILDATSGITFSVENGNMSTDVGGDIITKVTSGNYTVDIDGGVNNDIIFDNTNGKFTVTTGSAEADAINLSTTNGGILIDNNSDTEILELRSASSALIATGATVEATVDETNGLSVNKPKEDYLQWISYNDFDSFSNTIWASTRDEHIQVGSSSYFWLKDVVADTAIIATNIRLPVRATTDKGTRLKSIYVAYEVRDQALLSIAPVLTLTTFSSAAPTNAPVSTDIAITNNLGLSIDYHYDEIIIDSPVFVNTESNIILELSIESDALTLLRFYGIHLSFDVNHT